jgi:hypothetical protein
MLESGEFATIADLAERECIAPSYMTRVLRLTLLAPDTVEAILNGTQGPEVTLARVLEPCPADWQWQVGQVASKESKLHVTDQGSVDVPVDRSGLHIVGQD